jgi:hypothetical protein
MVILKVKRARINIQVYWNPMSYEKPVINFLITSQIFKFLINALKISLSFASGKFIIYFLNVLLLYSTVISVQALLSSNTLMQRFRLCTFALKLIDVQGTLIKYPSQLKRAVTKS